MSSGNHSGEIRLDLTSFNHNSDFVDDAWSGFKIAALRIDGIPAGAVRLSALGDGDADPHSSGKGRFGEVDVKAYYPHRDDVGVISRSKDSTHSAWEIVLQAVREVGVCYSEIVRYTAGGRVALKEMGRSVVYVVGNEVWAIDGEEAEKRDRAELHGREIVGVKKVGLCKMCDRHVVEEREWISLTLRLEDDVKERVKDLALRSRSGLDGVGGRPRFWSTHVVGCVGRRELEGILEGGVTLRLKRCFDWITFVRVALISIGVVLLTFGLAIIALLFYILRNAVANTEKKNTFVLRSFNRDFYFAEATIVGSHKPWFKELLADDNIKRDLEWPAQVKDGLKRRRITTKRIRKIPLDGLLLRGEGRAVTVSFRINSICSMCGKKKNTISEAIGKTQLELEPQFDLTVLAPTSGASLKVIELRDTCLQCLKSSYEASASSWFFGHCNQRAPPSGHESAPEEETTVLGLIGTMGSGKHKRHFVSCGLPQDGLVDYALEISSYSANRDKWHSIALHKGPWTGCGWSPQRIVID